MLSVKDQLSILVELSKADNEVSPKELEMIREIGHLNGLSDKEIENIIKSPAKTIDLKKLPPEQKFYYLYNVVQLMKVDGKVFRSEISFGENVAVNLGYKPGVIIELSSYMSGDPSLASDEVLLKNIANKHLD